MESFQSRERNLTKNIRVRRLHLNTKVLTIMLFAFLCLASLLLHIGDAQRKREGKGSRTDSVSSSFEIAGDKRYEILQHIKYMSCASSVLNSDSNDGNGSDSGNDIDYVLEKLLSTPTSADPFKWVLHICNFLPPDLFDSLDEAFTTIFFYRHEYEKKSKLLKSCYVPKKCNFDFADRDVPCKFQVRFSELIERARKIPVDSPAKSFQMAQINKTLGSFLLCFFISMFNS